MRHALTTIATRAALVLAMASPIGAYAGLVTGNWDPLFGAFLPELSYQVRAVFSVPDACSGQVDGTYSASSGLCAGATVQSARLRLYQAGADVNNFMEQNAATSWSFDMVPPITPPADGAFGVSQVRVQGGQVLGVAAGQMIGGSVTAVSPVSANFAGVVPSALNNSFGLHFTAFGPVVTCFGCSNTGSGFNSDNSNRVAGTTGLTQFLVTFNDNGESTAGVDSNGKPIGAVLDSRGNFVRLGTTGVVPEPGSLGLALTALLALGALGRRSRHPGR